MVYKLPDHLSVQKLDGKRDLAEVKDIRRKVFVEEQNVSEGEEWDGLDVFYTHYLFKDSGKPVGTARAKISPHSEGKIGRFCLVQEARGKKNGIAMLEYIIDDLKKTDKNIKNIKISAQTTVVPFYEKAGFEKQGNEYLEANIPHYAMVWSP